MARHHLALLLALCLVTASVARSLTGAPKSNHWKPPQKHREDHLPRRDNHRPRPGTPPPTMGGLGVRPAAWGSLAWAVQDTLGSRGPLRLRAPAVLARRAHAGPPPMAVLPRCLLPSAEPATQLRR